MPGHTSAKRQSQSLETITGSDNIQPIEGNSNQKTKEPEKAVSREESRSSIVDNSECERCKTLMNALKITAVIVAVGAALYALHKYGCKRICDSCAKAIEDSKKPLPKEPKVDVLLTNTRK